MRAFACFIAGAWQPGHTPATMPVTDKATGATIGTVPRCDAVDIDAAVRAAHAALPDWRRRPMEERAAMLRRCAQAMREQHAVLGAWTMRELGRPREGAEREVVRSAEMLEAFADQALQLQDQWAHGGRVGEQMLVVREPVGVVAAITPFNYPITLLCTKLGAALLAGCTVVAKPAEDTPVGTLLLAELFAWNGLPPGVFQVVTGTGEEAGMALVAHPLVRKIAFTGGTAAGKAIAAAAAGSVKRLTLELGGHCPAIVCADAALSQAVPQIVRHAYANSGQLCYRINRIYAHQAIYESLVQALAQVAATLKVGAPDVPGMEVGPLVNRRMWDNARRQTEDAAAKGARILCGGARVEVAGCEAGWFFAPTLIADATPDMLIMQQETFGPVVAVQRVADDAQALHLANAGESGLAAFVFTQDLARGLTLCQQLEAGSVWLNDIGRSSHRAPFGGVKQSGLGREKASLGIESYLEFKTIYLSYAVPELAHG